MNPTEPGNAGRPPAGSAENQRDPLRERLASAAERAAGQTGRRYERSADAAAGQIDEVAEGMRETADRLRSDDDGGAVSEVVAQLADGIGRLADTLRDKSADEVLRDLRGIGRRNPALFVAGSVAVGFGLARLAKASTSRPHAAAARPDASRHAGSPGGRPERRSPSSAPANAGVTAAASTDSLGTSLGTRLRADYQNGLRSEPAAATPTATRGGTTPGSAGAARTDCRDAGDAGRKGGSRP